MTTKVFALTGAGISAESGLRTWRGHDGMWNDRHVEDVATPEGFARDPAMVQAFYDARHADVTAARPNAAHEALARLGRDERFHLTLVTQNIDDLHERAGSASVIHMHGQVGLAVCSICGAPAGWAGRLADHPRCGECGGMVRPDITWFGEMPKRMAEIEAAFLRADMFLCIGTAGQVFPAADYARRARNRKVRHRVEFNLGPTDLSPFFSERRRGPASQTLPAFVAELLQDDLLRE